MTAEELESWFFNSLGACGCGDPIAVFEMVKEILEGLDQEEKDRDAGVPWVYPSAGVKRQQSALPYAKKDGDDWNKWEEHPAFWLVMYWLNHIELLEHGGSARASWMTGKGSDVLAAMREHGHGFLEMR